MKDPGSVLPAGSGSAALSVLILVYLRVIMAARRANIHALFHIKAFSAFFARFFHGVSFLFTNYELPHSLYMDSVKKQRENDPGLW